MAILFCGIVFATYTRVNVSEEGLHLMAGVYKCVAKIAETFVFVYLGMACVRMDKVGLFTGTVWRLAAIAILACFIGRLHIFVGSYLTNRSRDASSDPPPISLGYQIIMWLSGLRGGVAFAIAAVSWKHMDFPMQCGGFPLEHCGDDDWWESNPVPNDSTAVLQMTMIVALFTIFVLGGSMATVARLCGAVYEPGASPAKLRMDNKPAPLLHFKTSPALRKRVERSHSWLVRCLTHEEDYEHVFIDQDEALDRFIGRGSVHYVSRRPSPPQRAKSHGALPGVPSMLPESLLDDSSGRDSALREPGYQPPAAPSSTRSSGAGGLWQPSTSGRRSV